MKVNGVSGGKEEHSPGGAVDDGKRDRKRGGIEGAEVTMSGAQHAINSSVGVGGSATFQCTVRSDVQPHIQVRARPRFLRINSGPANKWLDFYE